MNDGLVDAFRHNAWATRQLLPVCHALTPAQLAATVPGIYGNPVDTLRHIIAGEAGYYFRLADRRPSWDWRADAAPDFDTLTARAEEMAARWEEFLTTPFDAERLLSYEWEDGTRMNVPAGVVLAQALHHGTEHRAQICTFLTAVGVRPPELGVWEFAEATGRATAIT